MWTVLSLLISRLPLLAKLFALHAAPLAVSHLIISGISACIFWPGRFGSDFLLGQLPVPIFIQSKQCLRRCFDLVGIDDMVPVFIERLHDRMFRGLTMRSRRRCQAGLLSRRRKFLARRVRGLGMEGVKACQGNGRKQECFVHRVWRRFFFLLLGCSRPWFV